jgi:hypothetical protein
MLDEYHLVQTQENLVRTLMDCSILEQEEAKSIEETGEKLKEEEVLSLREIEKLARENMPVVKEEANDLKQSIEAKEVEIGAVDEKMKEIQEKVLIMEASRFPSTLKNFSYALVGLTVAIAGFVASINSGSGEDKIGPISYYVRWSVMGIGGAALFHMPPLFSEGAAWFKSGSSKKSSDIGSGKRVIYWQILSFSLQLAAVSSMLAMMFIQTYQHQ